MLWVCLTLGIVLGVLALVVRLLRRFAMGNSGGRGRLRMEVVQRLSLGPKQGIAVVRVGDRLLAVSLGEGGVRPLAELGEAEQALLAEEPTTAGQTLTTAMSAMPAGLAAMFGKSATSATADLVASAAMTSMTMPVARTRTPLLSPLPPMAAVPDPRLAHAQIGMPSSPNALLAQAGMPAIPDTPSGFGNLLRAALHGGAVATLALLLVSVTSSTARAQQTVPLPATAPVIQPAAIQPAVGQAVIGQPPAGQPSVGQAAVMAPAAGQPAAPQRATGASTPTGAGQARPLTPAPLPSVVPVPAPGSSAQPATTAAAVARPATPANAPAPARSGAGAGTSADEMIARLAPSVDLRMGDQDGGLRLSGTVGVIVMMGLLTLLPTLVLMMTGFTRILIVLHFLRQALGTQSAPPSHLVAGLALLLTGFVMAPTLREVNQNALEPWMNGEIAQTEMLSLGVVPFRDFMSRQTRDADIRAFLDMSDAPEPATMNDVPLVVLTSAFVTSELRTAFQIGFALFLPFIVIDVVVASVLMSMGMFMLPPAMISLPFKLLLFVLVDGWALLTQSIVASFK